METKPKGLSTLKVLLIILGIVVIGGGAALGYYIYKSGKGATEETKKLTTTTTKKTTPATKETAEEPETETETSETADSGCAEFSEEETATMADWLTYTNSTYNYTFKYPSSWTATAESDDLVNVRGTDSGEAVSFQARTASKTEIGFPEFTLTGTSEVQVNCETATQNNYDGDESQKLINQTFTKSGNPYLLMFSYKDLGASYSGDMVDIDNMILKTFTFS